VQRDEEVLILVEALPRGRNPFDETGVTRDAVGVARYVDRPPSLVAMLRASVDREPGATALVEVGGRSASYEELWERSARTAGGLRAAGVGPGDRVAIRMPNGIDWVLAFFATQLLGAVAVPVNTRLTEEEVAYVVGDCEAALTFEPGQELPSGEAVEPHDAQPGELAAIFYTSGTTGFPKGAMTSNENFLTNSENAFRCLFTERSEGPSISTLISVPLFHVTGCNSQLIPMLEMGGRVEILEGALDLEGFCRAIADNGVNQLVSVPAIYHALLRYPGFQQLDVSGVRWVSYGGAPIDEALVARIMKAFPNARVGNGFGLTETSSLTSFLPHEEATEHADSVGFAMPVVDLSIDEPDPASGVGELLVRGPNVVRGYWRKPEADETTFTDGWLHTGDVARVDEEGLLYIVDRKKDMINRGGENVYSIEVENVLASAPAVAEAAVVAVPDDMMGEKVGAVLVATSGRQIDINQVLSHCRVHLADFKVPQYFSVREFALPRNPSGKLLKARIRQETRWGKEYR
jgi:acyl-CoA synthetase (AMP-forming)/AMP-acid ligase II